MFGMFNRDNNYSNGGYDNVNSNLQIQFNNLKSQYDNAILNQSYQEKEYKKLKSMVENLCKSILSNEYNYNQLGGNSILKGMDVYKLIEFTTTDHVKQKLEQKQIIDKLIQQTITQSEIIKTLKEQLTQTMVFNNTDVSKEDLETGSIINNTSTPEMNVFQNNNNFDMGENDFISAKIQGKIEKTGSKKQVNVDLFGNVIDSKIETTNTNEEYKNEVKVEVPPTINRTNKITEDPNSKIGSIFGNVTTNNKNKVVEEEKPNNTPITKPNNFNNSNTNNFNNSNNITNKIEPKETTNAPKLTIENVDSYIDAMTPIMWDVLEVIGTYGYSTSNDILDEINKEYEKYKKGLVLNTIASLTKMNILSSDQISTGFKRFKILKISNKGQTMYKIKFNKEPIESEIDKIIRDHDNVVHGYTIRDAKDLMLTVFNCTDVTMDRQKVSIKLPNGKTYIPDIVAVNPKKYKMYLEIELGNTPQNDFNDKCSKMVQVTKHLYFIADVEETKRKLENQVSLWVLDLGGKEKVAGVTIYITTMTQLSKGEWSRVLKY